MRATKAAATTGTLQCRASSRGGVGFEDFEEEARFEDLFGEAALRERPVGADDDFERAEPRAVFGADRRLRWEAPCCDVFLGDIPKDCSSGKA